MRRYKMQWTTMSMFKRILAGTGTIRPYSCQIADLHIGLRISDLGIWLQGSCSQLLGLGHEDRPFISLVIQGFELRFSGQGIGW